MAKQIIKMSDESYIQYSPTWWIKWDKDPKKREKNPTAQDEFDKKYDEFHMFLDMYSYLSIGNFIKLNEEDGCLEMFVDNIEIHYPDDNSFIAKFFSGDAGNNRGVGFGIESLPSSFYKDLFNLFKDENDKIDGIFQGTFTTIDFDGYFKFKAELKENGLHWDTESYQYENDDDYENCQGCGEELWSEEGDTNISDTHAGYCFLCEGEI